MLSRGKELQRLKVYIYYHKESFECSGWILTTYKNEPNCHCNGKWLLQKTALQDIPVGVELCSVKITIKMKIVFSALCK